MTKKSIAILAVAALFSVGLAVAAVLSQPRIEVPNPSGGLVFPTMVKDLDGLKSVIIRHGGETLTLDWDGKGFSVRERHNYPADTEKVRALVARLARMTKVEAKTRDPSRYDRLALGDPAAKDGQAKQVTLVDTNGKEFANVVIGKRKFTLGGPEGATYVRVVGDPQTWLALGDITVGDGPREWLRHEIADIKDKSVKKVTVTRPNGEKIVVSRTKPDAAFFSIDNVPKGLVPVSDFAAEDFARLLSNLNLDDVGPADSVAFPKDKTTAALIEGTDGFQVTLEMVSPEKDKFWVRLKGSAAPEEKADSESAKAIAALNARAEGWAFQVPAYQVTALTQTMAQLTKKPDPKGSDSKGADAKSPMGALPPGAE